MKANLIIPVKIYLLKVNSRNIEIFSDLTIKTPERRHWLFVSIVDSEQEIASWNDVSSGTHNL